MKIKQVTTPNYKVYITANPATEVIGGKTYIILKNNSMTKEEIINQVEPNGELLTTEQCCKAMDIFGEQQSKSFDLWKAIEGWEISIIDNEIFYYNDKFIGTGSFFDFKTFDFVYLLFLESSK